MAKTVTPTLGSWKRLQDKVNRIGGGSPVTQVSGTGYVSVRNDSGGDLPLGACVQLGDHTLAEYSSDYPWFAATGNSTPATGSFGILRRATKEDERGDCIVSGRCIARVNVLNASHTHAFPKAGQAYLESGMIGPVRLLSKSADTGVVDCWAIVGVPVVPLLGITVDDIGRTADGTINLVRRTATGYTAWLDGSSAQLTVEARAFWLQSAEEIAAGIAVNIGMVEGYFLEATVAACAVRNWELESE